MSSINPNNIDGTYPIAGQDNDSQGFRDNFTNIKNNFQFAFDELTDLQNKAVLKSSLSGGSINNDMNYSQLISPQLLRAVEKTNDLAIKSGSFSINWADAHYQSFTTGGNCTLSFTNWPTSQYWTKLRLQITTGASEANITWPSGVKEGLGLKTIQGYQGSQVVRLARGTTYLFELTTTDNGGNITIRDLLRAPRPIVDILNPSANVAVTANIGTSHIHFITATADFTPNITLPNTSIHGTTLGVSANVAMNLRLYDENGATITPAVTPVSAGSRASYYYDASSTSWYKIG